MNLRIIKDIAVIQLVKAIELLIPIITIPIIIKCFGLSGYGFITMFLVFSNYLILLGDWGFNINAVKFFSNNSNSSLLVFFEIQKCKIIFLVNTFIVSLIIWLIFLPSVDILDLLVFIIWCLSNLLLCRWYFQAHNKLMLFAITSLFFKLISLVYVFFIMDISSDITEYLLAISLPNLIFCLCVNLLAVKKELSDGKCISIKKIIVISNFSEEYKKLFKEGWYLISSRIISNAYNPMIIFISKMTFGVEFVGFLGFCQKIVGGLITLMTPIIEVTFPLLAKSYSMSRESLNKNISLISLSIVALSTIGMFILIVFYEYIFEVFNIEVSDIRIYFLIIYAMVIPVSCINSLLVNGLVIMGSVNNIVRYTFIGVFVAFIILLSVNSMVLNVLTVAFCLICGPVINMIMMLRYEYFK